MAGGRGEAFLGGDNNFLVYFKRALIQIVKNCVSLIKHTLGGVLLFPNWNCLLMIDDAI